MFLADPQPACGVDDPNVRFLNSTPVCPPRANDLNQHPRVLIDGLAYGVAPDATFVPRKIVTRVELISLEVVKMQALIANTNLETGDHQLARSEAAAKVTLNHLRRLPSDHDGAPWACHAVDSHAIGSVGDWSSSLGA